MKQFGYSLMKRTSVNIYQTDKQQWQQLVEQHPEFKGCISCGACAAACPMNAAGKKITVRKTIIELNRGIDVSANPADCQMCNRCTLVCPKGLNSRKVFFELLRAKK